MTRRPADADAVSSPANAAAATGAVRSPADAGAARIATLAPGVASIVIDHPPLSLLKPAVRREMGDAWLRFNAQREVRCLIFGSADERRTLAPAAAFLRAETQKWAGVIRAANIQPE